MKLAIGVICFVITIAAVGGNAIVMLISPRAWFRLPHWIRLSGSITEAKFSTGKGALQVRMLGGCFLILTLWFLHGCLARPR